jgi:perosamine synthetase
MPDPIVNTAALRNIPVARPSLGEAEAEAARDAVLSGRIAGGPNVERFEQEFAAAHRRRFGVATNSGTTALHLALTALDVRSGDEVIVPTLTMVAVGNAVLYCGATPVFVDSESESGNADGQWLKRVLTSRTKAAIVPHLYGVPAAAFLQALRKHARHLAVIEDCAECHYASLDPPSADPVGSIGLLACWSFYGNKIVSTGEGGLVATDDERLAARLRSLRAHAFTQGNHFHHQELAFGYRMTEMQAAIGLVQHQRRDELLARRKAIAARYIERLRDLSWAKFQARSSGSVWWVFPMLCPNESHRDRLRAALAESGVETRTWFVPLSHQPHLRRYAEHEYPVADDLSRRGLYLPLHAGMSNEDVDYICEVVWTI